MSSKKGSSRTTILPFMFLILILAIGYFLWQNNNASKSQLNKGSTLFNGSKKGSLVKDDFFQLSFSLPANESYIKPYHKFSPSGIGLSVDKNGGGQLQEETLKHYRIEKNDFTIEKYAAKDGSPTLIITGITETARAEGLRVLGTKADGQFIIRVNGSSVADLANIKSILDSINLTGKPLPFEETVQCTDPNRSDLSKSGIDDNGNYFVDIFYTRQLNEPYIQEPGNTIAEAGVWVKGPPTVSGASYNLDKVMLPANYSINVSDVNIAPFVEKIRYVISKDDLANKLGQNAWLMMTDGIAIRVMAVALKTVNGEFCGDVGLGVEIQNIK